MTQKVSHILAMRKKRHLGGFIMKYTGIEIFESPHQAQKVFIHELSNILCCMMTCAESAEISEKIERHKQMISVLKQGCALAQELISDFLLSQGGISRNLKLIDLRAVLQESIALVESCFQPDQFASDPFPEQPVLIWGRALLLKEVFINILKNAKEASNSGGKIKLSLKVEEELAQILIEDHGCGMDEMVLQNLFQPSSHLNERGIGLWFSQKVINFLGGNFSVESMKGKGSKFFIVLPVYG